MNYSSGTVRALLDTDAVTPVTRKVLRERLDATPSEPRFFNVAEMKTLRAVCDRLIPQPERATPIEIAAYLDERLANNKGNGWRYDLLPPDAETFRNGLQGLDESSRVLDDADFAVLDAARQDAVLRAVQNENAPGATWQTLPPRRFFEELLAEVTEIYYAHPIAQEEIGCVAMADAPGWTHIQLNQREEREPEAKPHPTSPL